MLANDDNGSVNDGLSHTRSFSRVKRINLLTRLRNILVKVACTKSYPRFVPRLFAPEEQNVYSLVLPNIPLRQERNVNGTTQSTRAPLERINHKGPETIDIVLLRSTLGSEPSRQTTLRAKPVQVFLKQQRRRLIANCL